MVYGYHADIHSSQQYVNLALRQAGDDLSPGYFSRLSSWRLHRTVSAALIIWKLFVMFLDKHLQ